MKIADAHCDTLNKLMYNQKCTNTICDFKKIDLQIFAIWDDWQKVNCKQSILNQTEIYNNLNVDCHKILSLEGLDILNNDKSFLKNIIQSNIKCINLTWNYDNCIAGSCNNNNDGISKYGYKVIKELLFNNKIIDVSHLGRKAFFDYANSFCSPIFASHSCCNKLCNNKRNLTDLQIKYITNSNGMIGVCFYPYFLKEDGCATIDDVVNHIDYLTQFIGNCDNICFGSDFDGIDIFPKNLSDILCINKISDKLNKKGYKKNDIYQIFYSNLSNFILK